MDDFNREKRRYKRTLVDEILRSAVIKPVGAEIEVWGMIIDQSVQGLQVALPIEISPKTEVEITRTQRDEDDLWDNKQYLGRVCWCKPGEIRGESFNVGIEFLDVQ